MTIDGYKISVVKVIIGEPEIRCEEEDNVITPFRRVRLILQNGEIFDRLFSAFGGGTEFYVKNFEEELGQWKKYEANERKK